MAKSPEWMNVREAAAYLRVAPHTLRNWVWLRKVPSHKVGGRVLFRREELRPLVQRRPAVGERAPAP